ncbi:hypothetical protein H8356DRAFT_1430942 [Neocallimastix lanati (nom. inval.)]|jgi:hypothetical protein|uniref:MATH domain-containing protein n=1 Tax=Neocallimastix californiae TaxID=1754190 RepID=A0A1Y2BUR5_9FUNG|nr:hypothetical protein H8356DRAFT_1430942 [Neocallimastix sp. JGI-2020a]ORY38499.1 hypothetical protein LY90DRAFT_672582 [Neocallimastix californiae]|eukprot:ORY38499.1 hypothetical protein LY90DRAFT_672582 [Neocallimastix californiae]
MSYTDYFKELKALVKNERNYSIDNKSMIEWKIENWSDRNKIEWSPVYYTGGIKWRMKLTTTKKYLQFFLKIEDESFKIRKNIFSNCVLSIRNFDNFNCYKAREFKSPKCFTFDHPSFGFKKFIKMSDLTTKTKKRRIPIIENNKITVSCYFELYVIQNSTEQERVKNNMFHSDKISSDYEVEDESDNENESESEEEMSHTDLYENNETRVQTDEPVKVDEPVVTTESENNNHDNENPPNEAFNNQETKIENQNAQPSEISNLYDPIKNNNNDISQNYSTSLNPSMPPPSMLPPSMGPAPFMPPPSSLPPQNYQNINANPLGSPNANEISNIYEQLNDLKISNNNQESLYSSQGNYSMYSKPNIQQGNPNFMQYPPPNYPYNQNNMGQPFSSTPYPPSNGQPMVQPNGSPNNMNFNQYNFYG